MRKKTSIAVLAFVLGVAVTAPLAVYASHQFKDVPDSHTFHNDIGWMRVNGASPKAATRRTTTSTAPTTV